MPSILSNPTTNLSVSPLNHSSGFGATVDGIDLNNLDQNDFEALERALYTHKVSQVPYRFERRGLQADL